MSEMSDTGGALVVSKTRTRRVLDPYDLSPSDNPGSIISQPPLRGTNYDEWSMNFSLALQAKKKFGFVDGSIAKPAAGDADLEDWLANNAMVLSWLKLTIDEKIRSSLSHHEYAHDLWTHIQRRFSVRNGQRVQRLKCDLANCHQKGTAVEAYYGKLTQLWTSLADYQQAKTMEEVLKEREEDKLHQFLMGLDADVYGSVKSSLLSRDPLPTLDEAYHVVTQDEESRITSRGLTDRTEEVSFAVQSSSRFRPKGGRPENKPRIVCSGCGKTGHTIDNCFRKIGYPEWWSDKSKGTAPVVHSKSSAPMSHGREGQIVNARANAVITAPVAVANNVLTNADRVGLTGLTDKQWQKLITLVNATEHSTSSAKLTGPHYEDADWSG